MVLLETPALLLQMALPWDWDLEQRCPPTSPMALLTAIVRKEAQLPEHTAAFAAAQLLPIIQAATERLFALQGQPFLCLHFCRELMVGANLNPIQWVAAAAGNLFCSGKCSRAKE